MSRLKPSQNQLVGKTNCSPHGYTATLTTAAHTKRPNCPLAWNIASITHFQIVKQEIFQPWSWYSLHQTDSTWEKLTCYSRLHIVWEKYLAIDRCKWHLVFDRWYHFSLAGYFFKKFLPETAKFGWLAMNWFIITFSHPSSGLERVSMQLFVFSINCSF